MRQRTERTVDGVQQPERGDIAGAELDDVLRGLPMQAIQCVHLGLQRVEHRAQFAVQERRGLQLRARRDELVIQLEAAAGGAPHARHRHGGVGIARLIIGQQLHRLAEERKFGFHRIGEQVLGVTIGLAVAGQRGALGIGAVGAVIAQQWQCQVDHGGLHARRQILQRHRIGQAVMGRRVVGLAVGEHGRQVEWAQRAARQRMGIETHATRTPGAS
ncbi:hypothetical protein G6F50_012341 [Rhizopus delemar]|uniref:Uncharacterized protein n=1 Tax=Rhizopus delemar TaxID=936053 RepID=A0A9P7CIU4_9FUNG|nr:hypothetical protein G6F50_012341 [Rhizopus delemar]